MSSYSPNPQRGAGSPRSGSRDQESSSRHGGSRPRAEEVPWNQLARNLRTWLHSLLRAQTSGQHVTVLRLMEVLVTFMECTGNGSFLRMLTPGHDVVSGLTALGASQSFIDSFMEMLQVIALDSATIMSFGASREAVERLREAVLAQSSLSRSAGARGRLAAAAHSGRRSRSMPHIPPSGDHQLVAAWDSSRDGAIDQVTSIEPFRLTNAVVVAAEALPVAVIEALSENRAQPFIIFRWLTTFYAEVLFCVQYWQTTYILGSKIVYIGPRSGSQLEGTLGLPSNEKDLILDLTNALEWHHIAGLLEASSQAIGSQSSNAI